MMVVLDFLGKCPEGVLDDQGNVVKRIATLPAIVMGFYLPNNDGRFVMAAGGRILHLDPFPYYENEWLTLEEAAKRLSYPGPVFRAANVPRSVRAWRRAQKRKGEIPRQKYHPKLLELIEEKIASGEWRGSKVSPYIPRNKWPYIDLEDLQMFSYWGFTGHDDLQPTDGGVRDEDGRVLPFGDYCEELIGAVLVRGSMHLNPLPA